MRKEAVLVDANVFYKGGKINPEFEDYLKDKEIFTTQTVYSEILKDHTPKNLKLLIKKAGVPPIETLIMKVHDKYKKVFENREKKHLGDLSLIIASIIYEMPIVSGDKILNGKGEELLDKYASQIGLSSKEKIEFKNFVLELVKKK
jgi:hypothetical protein